MNKETIYRTPALKFKGRLIQLLPEEIEAYNELKKKYVMSRLIGNWITNFSDQKKMYEHLVNNGFIDENVELDTEDLLRMGDMKHYEQVAGRNNNG